MKKFTTCLIILITLFNISLPGSGKELSRSKKVSAIKLSNNIKFDGKLSESIYKHEPVGGFVQRDPNEGQQATEKTNVWVSFDDSYLFISAKMYDSNPQSIDASLMRRDNMVPSDWFFVYLDPYMDRRTGYYFGVNPGGSVLDGTLYNDSWDDDTWDGIWEVKTDINQNGWTMEMRIPFSQLRFNETQEMKWGINFNRDIKRKNEMTYFVMVPKEESGFVSHFATLEGLSGIKQKQRLELLPYIVQKAQYLRHDTDDPFYKGNQYKTSLGADIKVGIGSNLNLDATINPDFGQVEVDPAVVNLSAFETFFDEKRPFFIEGSNILSFGRGGTNNNWGFNFSDPDLFYSRRIGRSPQGAASSYDYINYPNETRILGAGKLTGKINETWSIAALSAVTERTYASLISSEEKFEEEIEPLSHYGVFRTKKEFDEGRSAIGMEFTSVNRDLRTEVLKQSLVKQSYTFGVDGWTTLDEDDTYVLKGYLVGSYMQGSREAIEAKQRTSYRYFQRPDATFARLDPDRTSLSGLYSRIVLNKQKGNFYINTALGLITPGFDNNEAGFQWNADKINSHMVLGYRFFEPYSIFRRTSHYISHFRSYDFEGNMLTNGFMTFNSFQFLNYYNFGFRARYAFEAFSRSQTRGGPMSKYPAEYWVGVDLSTDHREKIVGSIMGSYWHDKKGGRGYDYSINLDWKPSTQLTISFGPSYSRNNSLFQWVDSFEDPTAVNTFGSRYVFAEIDHKTISGDIRLNWTFTPQLSLQLFLQPLISAGNYKNYKELSKPKSTDFYTYGTGNSTIDYDQSTGEYTVDPDGENAAHSFSFSNPNFNFKSLRGNLVLRYEVLTGSVLYLVWSHNKTNIDDAGDLSFRRDFRNLINEDSDNIFLLKFSYWFDI